MDRLGRIFEHEMAGSGDKPSKDDVRKAEIRDAITSDWTVDPATGRSNSSSAYLAMVAEIESAIRQEGHALINGGANSVARMIVSTLAHAHSMRPDPKTPLLTAEEHEAMELTVKLWEKLVKIVGQGSGRRQALGELGNALHVVQRMIGGQAAARAYPSKYRLLGE